VKAVANTEVYRPFSGAVHFSRLRSLPLARAGIRTLAKRKLPLVILLAPLAIATVIFAFVVYTRFALEAGDTPSALGVQPGASDILGAALRAGAAQRMVQTRDMIVGFDLATNIFSLLLMAWFGSGLVAEDRRLGAHLLYFARPLTKLDYLLAKFMTVAFYGALGAVLPGLVICTVATFASPEWSFVTQESDVIFATLASGCLWTIVVSSAVLAVSSLASRRTFALIGVFAWFLLTGALAAILAQVQHEPDFRVLSPFMSAARVAAWMFDLKHGAPNWSLSLSCASLGATVALAWLVCWARVRRLEVVA
jgi:ABC-2 type transport system permease protein